ncbi:alpha/beta-hydrolase [Linderina pennispora]|uniref:Alpha/beta-hydrolase n=1 Tax=Linderina pennispora TaxID=61395 RepID=A0A1Y1WCJ3_9FUNG|nr:alpha/beta-hydrolase [Linderina pennispora]ORX71267.1 alpha/beta-hydrolase [Linderina pennispora]
MIAHCVLLTIYRFYRYGPETKSWDLRFHIIKDVMHTFLADSLPHDLKNTDSQRINYREIADYISLNNLPVRPLTLRDGVNREFSIEINHSLCVDYPSLTYKDSGRRLQKLAQEDRRACDAQAPRTLSFQCVLGKHAMHCHTCKSQAMGSKILAPYPIRKDEQIILHFHGGAYCLGERSLNHLFIYANTSSATNMRVFSPNYALAPRHCFPQQLHDCYIAYRYLLNNGFAPRNIFLGGDSAGGTLALGLLLLLKDLKMEMPRAAMLVSPWVDVTCPGNSWLTNRNLDYLPAFSLDDPFHPTRMFYDAGRPLSQQMLEELKCPLVSPVYGDLSGLPPLLVQMGQNELLHDDICTLVAKIKKQNRGRPNAVTLEVYKDMPHVFVLFDFTDAAKRAFGSMANFVQTV